MPVDFGTLFGQMCHFKHQPPLLFGIPHLPIDVLRRLAEVEVPVELLLPDLDSFSVSADELERIRWAVATALMDD